MADSKITDLPILTTPLNADVLPIVDVGNDSTKKISILDLRNAVNGNLPSVSGNWNSVFTNVNSNSANWGVAGTGTEIQFKNGSVFGAVSGTSVLGNEIILGSTETVSALSGSNTVSRLRIRNTNPATSVRKQNSPALTWEGQAWSTNLGRSYTIQFRAFVEPALIGDGGGSFVLESVREGNVVTRFITCSNTPGGTNPSINFNATNYFFGGGNIQVGGSGGVKIISSAPFSWAPGGDVTAGTDLILARRSAGNLLLGGTDAASPIPQTLSLQSVAGSANAAGALFTIDGSRSTGTANGGDIRFRTTKSSITPSSTLNSLDEVFRLRANGAVNFTPIATDPTGNSAGDVYYNSTFNSLELFNGTAFVPVNTTRTIATFTALENHPVSANFATLNTRNFDNVGVLQFAAGATIQNARFISVIPDNAVLTNGLLIRTQFSTITATSGSCRWGAQIKKLSSTSYAASAGIDVTVSGTANQTIMTGIISLPSTDSLAPGDAYALRIFRESNDVADTLVDSAQLLTVEVRTNI